MKKTVKKNIIILILTFVIIACLIGSFIVYAKNEEGKPTLQTKVTEEINYLENYLISILGDFNSLSIQENTIQLNLIKQQVKNNKQKQNRVLTHNRKEQLVLQKKYKVFLMKIRILHKEMLKIIQ